MTIQRILFPTDFSAASDAAFDVALFMAEICDAELVLQHVIALGDADPAASGLSFPPLEQILAHHQELARTRLGHLMTRSQGRPLRIRERVDQASRTADGILECARAESAALLVLGTHGRTGPAHLLLGSVTASVLAQAPCPVLTQRAGEGTFPLVRLARILALTDFSPGARQAVAHAAWLARLAKARLDLVHIQATPEVPFEPSTFAGGWSSAFFEDLEPRLREGLDELRHAEAADLQGENLVIHGRGAHEVIALSEQADVDLLVQGTSGRTGLRRALLGSFAERVARLAACAVLTVPLGAKRWFDEA